MRILVVTVVHHPEDARIRRRQIGALDDAGHEVTLAAPWSAFGADPGGIRSIDLPRAAGRARVRSLRAAIGLLGRQGGMYDLILIHDPELLLAVRVGRPTVPVVWDVHEDTAAALIDRPWLPRPLRWVTAALVYRMERWAEGQLLLILAEERYAERFQREHTLIRNLPPVPAQSPEVSLRSRVVYVGRISRRRGATEMVALSRRLSAAGIHLDLIGPADADVEAMVLSAAREGILTWHGFLPNEEALRLVDGCLAGLSLLHDTENYRISAPTKVYEYLSRGVPVVTSPLPIPAEVVADHGLGLVVRPENLEAIDAFIRRLRDEPGLRQELGEKAHDVAKEYFDWSQEARRFVAVLEQAAGYSRGGN